METATSNALSISGSVPCCHHCGVGLYSQEDLSEADRSYDLLLLSSKFVFCLSLFKVDRYCWSRLLLERTQLLTFSTICFENSCTSGIEENFGLAAMLPKLLRNFGSDINKVGSRLIDSKSTAGSLVFVASVSASLW